MIPPGSTIGILGGGQLGRMTAMAAARLGYRCHVFAPEAESPAADVAAAFTNAPYEDGAALAAFAAAVDVVTLEFENVPVAAVEHLAARRPVWPGAEVLRITQEALQNVRKHAAATEVRISLDGNRLVIADNGRGFDVMRLATGATRNFGLQFMRERAELMGSELQIESRQGEGTRILLRLPEPLR